MSRETGYRRGGVLLAVVAAVVLAAAPAQAHASDVASTHAYIEARYQLARAGVALIHPVEHKVSQAIAGYGRECPKAGLGSLQTEASQPMSYEVAVALWEIEYGTAAAPIHAFVRATQHLRWSNSAIAHAASRYARDLSTLAALKVPPLCESIHAWKLTGFQQMPAAVASQVSRVEGVEPLPVSPGLLARFERGSDASVLHRTLGLERKITEQEFLVGQIDWLKALDTLGLTQ